MKKDKKRTELSEKATLTPEMIPSMFNWLTPDIQSIQAEHLDKATKK